jgi:hypothetical protein
MCCFHCVMSDGPSSNPTATDDELLGDLRRLLAERGKLTMSLIEASRSTRSPNTYIRRFGSLTAAYERIGYEISERQRAAATRFRKAERGA